MENDRMGDILEQDRLAALKGLSILDTPHEPLFDSFVSLVAESFAVPVALISLVDEHRQWFKAVKGLSIDHTARAVAFCDHTIRSSEVMVVPDATQDERFRENPLVMGEPHIRFYAGAPLVAPEDHRIGTLSLIGFEPRQGFPDRDALRLKVLADTIMLTLTQRALALQAEQLDAVRSLLMREVDHRARNALSVVQSIVQLTRAPDIVTFKELILGRISALARAQGVLTQGRWAPGSARRIVEGELAVLARPERARVLGEDMPVAAGRSAVGDDRS
jgi:GAF domain-containing protein